MNNFKLKPGDLVLLKFGPKNLWLKPPSLTKGKLYRVHAVVDGNTKYFEFFNDQNLKEVWRVDLSIKVPDTKEAKELAELLFGENE